MKKLFQNKPSIWFIILLLVIGCGKSTKPITPEEDLIEIHAEGWIERGATISVTAELDEDVIPDSLVIWAVAPEGSVEFLPGGKAVLKAVGSLTISAFVDSLEGSLNLDVSPAPLIAFDMLVDDNRDIYVATIYGEDVRSLTQDPAEDTDPSVAKETVLFTSYRYGNGELCTTTLNGGGIQRITVTSQNEIAAVLDPDASLVAYISDISGVPKLWLGKSDGTETAQITSSLGFPGSPENSPNWAPSENKLTFAASVSGHSDLFEYSLDDGNIRTLLTSEYTDIEPAWSRDGNLIAFASRRGAITNLYLLDATNGQVSRLTNRLGIDAQPAWLPDGRLVYTAWIDDVPRLYWLDIQSSEIFFEIPLNGSSAGNPTSVY